MKYSRYVEWLSQQGVPIFETAGIYWRLYQNALIPASVGPCYVTVDRHDARGLLNASGAWFVRYSSDPGSANTAWWYVICDAYDPKRFSAKTRQNINRGTRSCLAKVIEPAWLAGNGYNCYRAAYQRYRNANPKDEEDFRNEILSSSGAPFEYWGVFVGDRLAGYCRCIVDERHVNTSVTKYDPECLKLRSAYTLVSAMVEHYVNERGMTVSNGNRAVAHDTNYQEFLVNLGFRKEYCRLNIIYQPWLQSLVKVTFPFHQMLERVPDAYQLQKLKALMFQEGLRRLSRVA